MTNRYMVKRSLMAKPAPADGVSGLPEPNRSPLPAMPAPEDSLTPTTNEEPVDSPQPNASAKRGPPGSGELGLSTRRES
ncbi:MAG TPA: hypothetical protein VGU70_02500 [Methylobacterium sp.]|nr:hypothetical protein [Methylorubrum sp. B1-46]UGB24165.1 hypothetical protein LPC10_14435 [Methylorubrum sp. B1-46]HEV2541614.1 hypothetical protein [Methylobacterium sp.]